MPPHSPRPPSTAVVSDTGLGEDYIINSSDDVALIVGYYSDNENDIIAEKGESVPEDANGNIWKRRNHRRIL